MNIGDIVIFDAKKNFTFQKTLGSGGTGDTHLFKDETTDMLFAIKKYVPKDKRYIDEYYKRFVDEIKILFNISHPNIVRIYNYYLYPALKTGYLQMEYINGISIDNYNPKNFGEKGWKSIFVDVINAFDYLESNNILHRDIRASNILIDHNGNVKIIDFGFGKQLDVSRNDGNSILLNWPATEMPDEVKFEQKYDERTEIYFVGALFKNILEEEFKDFCFKHIIEKMIMVNPGERYNSFSSIMTDINAGALSESSFTEEQKSLYRNFADALCGHISCYKNKYEPINDVTYSLSLLADLIRSSSLEEYLQDNRKLIGCFIKGSYRYYDKKDIPMVVVRKFYGLLTTLTTVKRSLVMANINIRLATIKTVQDDNYIPF